MTEELCHIRCIECGKVIAHKWDKYQEMLSQGIPIEEALNRLGLNRYCCRMRMMNPFKVPSRSDRQDDIDIETQTERLSIIGSNVATPNYDTPSPLPVFGNTSGFGNTFGVTSQITLPAIPEVALPPIPAPGADVAPEHVNRIIRSYQAW